MRKSLPFAALLLLSATAAQASPVCYMDTAAGRVDLSHMCGSEGSSPPVSVRLPSQTQSAESDRQVSATIQILRANYSSFTGVTIVETLVEFGRSAHVGDSAVPQLTTYTGTFVYPRVTLARGQKQYYLDLRLSGQFTVAEIQAQLVDSVAVR